MLDWELTPEEIKKKIDEMVWSFSRITSSHCMYSWYITYIEQFEGEENAYAQFGTLCHGLIEDYLKGKLDMFTITQAYIDRYPEIVTCDFPSNKYSDLGQKAYDEGLAYFSNIDFDFDRYEILGVEKELLFNVGKYKFKGYADAVYKDRQTGEIILRDHKTSGFKYLKNGNVAAASKKQFEKYIKQEYLYTKPLIEEYGKVDYLTWNMIRDQREIRIPFNQKDYEDTFQWAIESIEAIEGELFWTPNTENSFYCNVLCDCKGVCTYRN